ncbi:PIG-L deacetylase family protein [Pelosinus sp. sgz500959]|uniref:PIG-L deacetylase family protein n=1 Tax=Pelosinus sp. sgz500959 TaxID=3242472 RepID=UPI00366D341C
MKSTYKIIYIIISLCLIIFYVDYNFFYFQEKPDINVKLPSLILNNKQTRLLVFAPHCDDETLGCAGVIQDVLKSGGQVLIVFITNGDGFTIATKEQFHRLFLTSEDYINSGYSRQIEASNALRILGVTENQAIFLGYPDRGLKTIWNDYWSISQPFRSRYTNSDHSPYTNTYQPNTPYVGEAVLENIEQIMLQFQPNLILAPHPADEHSDHATAWAFIATAYLKLTIGSQLPEAKFFTYLIHRDDFPIPHGYKNEALLLPPKPLYEADPKKWYTYQLNSDNQTIKEQSLKEYVSQLRVPIMSSLLYSFIRKNELFEEIYIPVLNEKTPNTDLSSIEAWFNQEPILFNPKGVNRLGALERKAKVVSIECYIKNNRIWLHYNIPEFSRKKNQYQVSIIEFRLQGNKLNRQKKVYNFSTGDTSLSEEDIIRMQDDVIIRLPNSQPLLPDFLFIQVDTKDKAGSLIDHTVWQPVRLQYK